MTESKGTRACHVCGDRGYLRWLPSARVWTLFVCPQCGATGTPTQAVEGICQCVGALEAIEVVPASGVVDPEELARLRVENAYLKDTSPACAAEAVREKERADRLEREVVDLQALDREVEEALDRAGAPDLGSDGVPIGGALRIDALVRVYREHMDGWR